MSLKNLKDVTYFRLNNEINRPVNNAIPLHKDKEAISAFFKENVIPNTKQFNSLEEKLNYIINLKIIILDLNRLCRHINFINNMH